jgi:hypothetical protein
MVACPCLCVAAFVPDAEDRAHPDTYPDDHKSQAGTRHWIQRLPREMNLTSPRGTTPLAFDVQD